MDEKLSLRYQLLSAWSGPAFLVTFIVFWGILSTDLPAPVSPALNPHDVAMRYLGSWTEMRIVWLRKTPSRVRFCSPPTCGVAAGAGLGLSARGLTNRLSHSHE